MRFVLGLSALSLAACAGEAPAPEPSKASIATDAGFITLAPRDLTLGGKPVHLATTARVFYDLRPADRDAETAPVFVLFNGFSAEVVRAFGTGPMTVAEGGDVVANPASLTALGSVLYVEPRQAGYSYDLPGPGGRTDHDCSSDVFNEHVDAADSLLSVLTILRAHPSLKGPIVWVGESYAGVRVQWILSYLRGRFDLAGLEDPTLKKAIADASPRELMAAQVLLQPWLAGKPHATAIQAACVDAEQIAKVSASVGEDCGADACACAEAHQRSRYNYTYATTRQKKREYEASLAHTLPDRAEKLLGVKLATVKELHADERKKGFKCSAPDNETPPDDALAATLGKLPAGEVYYVPYSPLQPGKEHETFFADWRYANRLAPAFVDNVRDVPTFITDGERDTIVPELALAPALRAAIGDSVVKSEASDALVLATKSGDRPIAVRHYKEAGHMITMIAPSDFERDVAAWLTSIGVR
jgi:pimeloyl-ACP methyl ester carboxylesterase